jgi:putative membrane protein insertion efficiency factor
MKRIMLYLVSFYQKYISIIFGYGSCRYYPTCSEYAKWQIDNNNIFKALLFSVIRILRCNQLFRGGIEYPLVKREFKDFSLAKKDAKKIKVKYWYIRKKNNIFYVIKEFKGNSSVR